MYTISSRGRNVKVDRHWISLYTLVNYFVKMGGAVYA